MDEVADALEREDVAHASAELLGDDDDSLCDVVGQVGEVIDVRLRGYQAFAGRRWLQRHVCSDDVVLVDEAGGRSFATIWQKTQFMASTLASRRAQFTGL